jgi:hypothetical protein
MLGERMCVELYGFESNFLIVKYTNKTFVIFNYVLVNNFPVLTYGM